MLEDDDQVSYVDLSATGNGEAHLTVDVIEEETGPGRSIDQTFHVYFSGNEQD